MTYKVLTIKPCAFCNTIQVITRTCSKPDGTNHYIACAKSDCMASGPERSSRDAAIVAWNIAYERGSKMIQRQREKIRILRERLAFERRRLEGRL